MIRTQHDMQQRIAPPTARLAYLNLTVNKPPARVFSPANPASNAFAVSIPMMNLLDLASRALIEEKL